MAIQIYEDNYKEERILLAGIAPSGYILAERLQIQIEKICDLKVKLVKVELDKDDPRNNEVKIPITEEELKSNVIILVDDVLNSGKTLAYAVKSFLEFDLKKLRTVLLVDRDHKRYPVFADFVGLSLSTSLKEHITVDLAGKEDVVYLS